jgi:hypothetical protein
LLVLRVAADHAHDPLAADDLAVLTDATNAASHFHDRNSSDGNTLSPPCRLAMNVESSTIAGKSGSLKGLRLKRHRRSMRRDTARPRRARALGIDPGYVRNCVEQFGNEPGLSPSGDGALQKLKLGRI